MVGSHQQRRELLFGFLIFVLGGVIGYRYAGGAFSKPELPEFRLINTENPDAQKDVDFNQFWEVWDILERDYVDPSMLKSDKMVQGSIQGLAQSLGDPYTMYLPPVDQKRSMEELSGAFFGIGIQLGYIDQTLAVMSPLRGTPAEKAGVKAGDLILHVTDEAKKLDEDTTNWSLSQAVDNLRGEKNSKVTVTLFRPKEKPEPFKVELYRDEIVVPSVELVMKEVNGKKVAHIIMSRFGDRTEIELEESITKILAEKSNLSGVVLDLRNNPGGYFESAIDVASEFIKDGLVVTQQGRTEKQEYAVTGRARLVGIPVVVIVNKGSASASEIVAGALRDRLGVKLVGEKSFGKGTVQDARQLSNGAGLHVTVAKWLLPAGEWIHHEGIPVDVEVQDNLETEADEVFDTAAAQLSIKSAAR